MTNTFHKFLKLKKIGAYFVLQTVQIVEVLNLKWSEIENSNTFSH